MTMEYFMNYDSKMSDIYYYGIGLMFIISIIATFLFFTAYLKRNPAEVFDEG
jgi:hypothetical protein